MPRDRLRLFHGGAPGLSPGDVIEPGMAEARYVDGCPDCEAHKAGQHGPISGDPPTPAEWVYASEDRQYARYYASRAVAGWLYGVELRGDVERATEDPEQFRCWRGREAVVTSVLERAVVLTMRERRRLFVRRLRRRGPASAGDVRLLRRRALAVAERRPAHRPVRRPDRLPGLLAPDHRRRR